MKKIFYISAMAILVACGKSPTPQQNTPTPQPTVEQVPVAPAPTPSAAPVPSKPAVEVTLASVGENMAFDKTALTVSAGQPVHLVFVNKSHSTTMQHNWALVKPGTEASVAEKGLLCSGRGAYRCPSGVNYVDTSDTNLLAFTPQAKAGETVEVTFTAPEEPGVYPYICTFPGHYMMMKGKLTVTP